MLFQQMMKRWSSSAHSNTSLYSPFLLLPFYLLIRSRVWLWTKTFNSSRFGMFRALVIIRSNIPTGRLQLGQRCLASSKQSFILKLGSYTANAKAPRQASSNMPDPRPTKGLWRDYLKFMKAEAECEWRFLPCSHCSWSQPGHNIPVPESDGSNTDTATEDPASERLDECGSII